MIIDLIQLLHFQVWCHICNGLRFYFRFPFTTCCLCKQTLVHIIPSNTSYTLAISHTLHHSALADYLTIIIVKVKNKIISICLTIRKPLRDLLLYTKEETAVFYSTITYGCYFTPPRLGVNVTSSVSSIVLNELTILPKTPSYIYWDCGSRKSSAWL